MTLPILLVKILIKCTILWRVLYIKYSSIVLMKIYLRALLKTIKEEQSTDYVRDMLSPSTTLYTKFKKGDF